MSFYSNMEVENKEKYNLVLEELNELFDVTNESVCTNLSHNFGEEYDEWSNDELLKHISYDFLDYLFIELEDFLYDYTH